MRDDLATAQALDRTWVGASRTAALARELKALIAVSRAMVAAVEDSPPARQVCAWKLATVADQATQTLREWGC